MTTVYMNPVLAACLLKAAPKLGSVNWQAHNAQQIALLAELPEIKRLLAAMPAGMLDSIGSTSAGSFHARHIGSAGRYSASNAATAARSMLGSSAAHAPIFSSASRSATTVFSTFAVLDILTKWQVPGKATKIYVERKPYPAVEMKGENIQVTTANGVEVVEPLTDTLKGDSRVLIVQADSLETGLAALRAPRAPVADKIAGVQFPMVDLNVLVDIDWLVGLTHESGSRLTKAVAQAKLRLDHLGAHAKAGAAIVVSRSMSGPRTIVIDKPFVVAFMVADQIAVAFHVGPADWKKPPNLGEKGSVAGETW